MAAEFDESGTLKTRSAFGAGHSCARRRPRARRARSTEPPKMRLSGRAKYTCSKTHRLSSRASNGKSERSPAASAAKISPGRMSRSYVAPTISSAQVSDAKTGAPFRRPMTRGRQPRGSRTASSVSPNAMTMLNAPSTPRSASASRVSGDSASERASRCTITSESIDEEKMEPRSSRSTRSSPALVMLPLCARAMCPPRELTSTGCAFSMVDEPDVL